MIENDFELYMLGIGVFSKFTFKIWYYHQTTLTT